MNNHIDLEISKIVGEDVFNFLRYEQKCLP